MPKHKKTLKISCCDTTEKAEPPTKSASFMYRVLLSMQALQENGPCNTVGVHINDIVDHIESNYITDGNIKNQVEIAVYQAVYMGYVSKINKRTYELLVSSANVQRHPCCSEERAKTICRVQNIFSVSRRRSKSNCKKSRSRSNCKRRRSRSNSKSQRSRSDCKKRRSRSNSRNQRSRSDCKKRRSRSNSKNRKSRSNCKTRRSRSNSKNRRSRSNSKNRKSRSNSKKDCKKCKASSCGLNTSYLGEESNATEINTQQQPQCSREGAEIIPNIQIIYPTPESETNSNPHTQKCESKNKICETSSQIMVEKRSSLPKCCKEQRKSKSQEKIQQQPPCCGEQTHTAANLIQNKSEVTGPKLNSISPTTQKCDSESKIPESPLPELNKITASSTSYEEKAKNPEKDQVQQPHCSKEQTKTVFHDQITVVAAKSVTSTSSHIQKCAPKTEKHKTPTQKQESGTSKPYKENRRNTKQYNTKKRRSLSHNQKNHINNERKKQLRTTTSQRLKRKRSSSSSESYSISSSSSLESCTRKKKTKKS